MWHHSLVNLSWLEILTHLPTYVAKFGGKWDSIAPLSLLASQLSNDCQAKALEFIISIMNVNMVIHLSKKWVYIWVQDHWNFEIKWSCWSRTSVWTQEVYTRVDVQGMKERSGINVVSLSHQISVISTQDKIPSSLRNQLSSLIPILSLKVRSTRVCFETQVSWT